MMMVMNPIYMVALVAALLLSMVSTIEADAFLGGPSSAFVVQRTTGLGSKYDVVELVRGGATAVDDEIEFESSDEEEEEEEEEELDPKLTKSAQTAASNIKTKMAKATLKAAVASTMPKKKSSSSSLMKFLHVPYILKACLNPFTVLKMAQGYFASLVNLNYLNDKVDTSQDLRSALEAKAKKATNKGGARGKRKFKPGQAKTLSDLPQLNT